MTISGVLSPITAKVDLAIRDFEFHVIVTCKSFGIPPTHYTAVGGRSLSLWKGGESTAGFVTP